MKLTAIISFLAAATTSVAATETVSYDPGYDQASRSMTAVACSDGTNGLITSKQMRRTWREGNKH
jgi:hypothetical protein